MRNGTLISQEDAARRIEDALRLRVGRGRRFSFPALSDATGIPTRTLESYVQGTTPQLSALLSICSVLGPSFTSDILAACGQMAHEASPGEPEHLRVAASLGELVMQISEAVADGYVDHREAAQMRPLAARLIELLEPLAYDPAARGAAMSGAALRIETGRMARFLGLMRDRLVLLGDGEIDAVERFCDAAGLVRLVQGPPEGGALVLLAVPSLRMLHFLDRIGCAPWAAMAVAFAGVHVPPEAGEVDDLLARAF